MSLAAGLARTPRVSTAIVWFRRDLRVIDHPALHLGASAFDRVLPVFVLDDALLEGRYRSESRTAFMLACLRELDEALRARGAGLVVVHGPPERELPRLAAEHGADAVLWTSDGFFERTDPETASPSPSGVSPYARRRDARVTDALRTVGVRAEPQPGTYVAGSVGQTYTVFSRFFKRWQTLERREVLPAPERLVGVTEATGVPDLDARQVASPVREPGERAARAALDEWLAEGIGHYGTRQNGMARVTTSRLSPYLRWGCLSARECEARSTSPAWTRQLAWRDFYAHTLVHHPANVRVEQQERYRDLDYDHDPDRLAAWAEGRTGYPLVDAGMRELATTGWMHNRVRLVTGSFLTKELHLDWRAGEEHFARLLLDGEPAQNNGNWQWIASVGTDPQPYFKRMYNPALHQERFDPEGEYVRRHLPALEGVPADKLAEPWTMTAAEQSAAGCVIGRDYPAPIVDRKLERQRAMDRYRAVAAGSARA